MSEVFPTFGKPTAVIALFACDRPVLGDADRATGAEPTYDPKSAT